MTHAISIDSAAADAGGPLTIELDDLLAALSKALTEAVSKALTEAVSKALTEATIEVLDVVKQTAAANRLAYRESLAGMREHDEELGGAS